MGRHVSLDSFQRGARAMLDEGIRVRVDLILGLPGDTVDSIRRGWNTSTASGRSRSYRSSISRSCPARPSGRRPASWAWNSSRVRHTTS